MIFLKVVQGMKPQDIAKKLKVSVHDVYKADKRVKVNLKKSKQAAMNSLTGGQVYFYEHRVLPQNDNRVKQEVGEYLMKHGLYDIKRLKV